jgi:hypothetical protein
LQGGAKAFDALDPIFAGGCLQFGQRGSASALRLSAARI